MNNLYWFTTGLRSSLFSRKRTILLDIAPYSNWVVIAPFIKMKLVEKCMIKKGIYIFLSACYIFSFAIKFIIVVSSPSIIHYQSFISYLCIGGCIGVCLPYNNFSELLLIFILCPPPLSLHLPSPFQVVIPHGEPVTIETFLAWRERFEAELALERAK